MDRLGLLPTASANTEADIGQRASTRRITRLTKSRRGCETIANSNSSTRRPNFMPEPIQSGAQKALNAALILLEEARRTLEDSHPPKGGYTNLLERRVFRFLSRNPPNIHLSQAAHSVPSGNAAHTAQSKSETSSPSKGALRAAEVMATQGCIKDIDKYSWARIIDQQTALPELLQALTAALPLIDDAFHKAKRDFDDAPHVAERFRLQAEAARSALSKAERGADK